MKELNTKTILFFITMLLGTITLEAQTAARDDALHAQERRMVFKSWGDWQPKGKYFLGVQTNPNHEMVWGWTAPAFGGNKTRNKNYQREDIRPLAPGGKQNARYLSFAVQNSLIGQMETESNELGNMALEELAYNSAVTAKVDPLYLLYFKETLKPVYDFSSADVNREVKDAEVYQFLSETGFIEEHIKTMSILKDRFNIAVESDMERGQRIIFYHKILSDYRAEKYKFSRHITTTAMYLKHKSKHGDYKQNTINPTSFGNWVNRDEEIAREIIAKSKVL